MNVTIHYRLTSEGQRANILAGGSGKSEQSLEVGTDSMDFRRALGLATIDSNGTAVLHARTRNGSYQEWNRIPAVTEILDAIDARKAAEKAKIDAEQAALRVETQRVLDERITKTEERNVAKFGIAYAELVFPAWPYASDSTYGHPVSDWSVVRDIRESESVEAWEAELDARNELAKVAALAELEAANAEKARIEAEKKAAEAERRASLGLTEFDVDLSIEEGCLSEVPSGMWESHSRGKNWMSVISSDPKAPGGLDRSFVEKAKGELFYILPSNLKPGDAIEFGADHYSSRGRKDANRWYGYVVRISAERVILRHCKTGKVAIGNGAKLGASLAATDTTVAR